MLSYVQLDNVFAQIDMSSFTSKDYNIQAYAWRLRPLCLGASDFAVSSEELAISVPLRQARITEDF